MQSVDFITWDVYFTSSYQFILLLFFLEQKEFSNYLFLRDTN